MTVWSEITKGRALRLWGAIGVSTSDLAVGTITGPPQLREYPVDPVGVATIRPSAQYEVRYSSFKWVSTVIMDEVSFLLTAISFKAKFSTLNSGMSELGATSNRLRSSMAYAPATNSCTTLRTSSFLKVERNPNRPVLTPTIGIPRSRT